LLGERLHNLRVKHALLGISTLMALLLTSYFFFSFYRGMTRDMAQQVRDETDLREAKVLAEQASVAKSQFLATMSHELRTPMNGILGMLTLLQKTPLTDKQRDYALKSETSAQSLLSLLNSILDFSKIEANKMVLDERVFLTDQFMQQVSVVLRANVPNPAVQLSFELDPKLPPALIGDDLRLGQILINLGGNALKFTERGEVTLSIGVAQQSDDIVDLDFSVKDTGIGIAPENQAKIFSGFSQAESSTTRRFGGTGLGLAISTRLVQLMGGNLQLQSKLGLGSTFSFQLRMKPAAVPQSPLPTSPPQQPDASQQLPVPGVADMPPPDVSTPTEESTQHVQRLLNLHILLVEDNFINQQIALELLTNEGADITVADNGQIAVDVLQHGAQTFDMVLMDLQMPVMDGFEATRVIRQSISTSLPIIAMTANALVTDRAACLDAGMNEHVGKPFHLDQLVAVILGLTGKSA
jgi:signal transduction histidine kinase/CheY-like chemotaxis protein